MIKRKQRLCISGIVLLGGALSAQVQGAGFALIEQSASGMGNAFAGGAASAEDASTVYYNPAGMANLRSNQLLFAGHTILP